MRIFKICFLLFQFFSVQLVIGQEQAVLNGRVLDDKKQPLKGAGIKISLLKTGERISSSSSTVDGSFRVKGIPIKDSLLVEVSFVGYEEFSGILFIEQRTFTMTSVLLSPASKSLKEVGITAQRKLMIIKQDTIEFRALDFKTLPNAKAESLLQRLPGLVIDKQGKLNFNGKPITKILVDGKVFFGENGQVALQNIPVDVIDRIQIIDAVGEAGNPIIPNQQMIGKELNIKMKDGNVYFGSIWAAGGTDKRYDIGGVSSKKENRQRLSLNGGINNVNRTGNSETGSASFITLTNGGGITKTHSASVDYSREWGDNGGSLTGNYNFAYPVTSRESILERRRNILENSSLATNSSSDASSKNIFHQLALRYRTTTKMEVNSIFNYQTTDEKITTDYKTSDDMGTLLNRQARRYSNKGNSNTLGVSGRFRLLKDDRNDLILIAKVFGGGSHKTDRNQTETAYYRFNQADSVSIINQEIMVADRTNTANMNLNYGLKLNRYWGLFINQRSLVDSKVSDKQSWNLDVMDNRIGLDAGLSARFKTLSLSSTSSAGLYARKGDWVSRFGGILYLNELNRQDLLTQHSAKQTLALVLPFIRIAKEKGLNAISFELKSEMNNPDIDQLFPVPDNSNPLSLKLGNPNLKPEISYPINFMFNKITGNTNNQIFFAAISYVPVKEKITLAIFTDSLGRQLNQYNNVSWVYTLNSYVNYTMTYKSGENRYSLGSSVQINIRKDKTYLNEILVASTVSTLDPAVNIGYFGSDKLEVLLNYTPSISQLSYTQNAGANQHYVIHNLSGNFGWYAFNRLKWNNSLVYAYNNQFPKGFDKSSVLWNMGLSYLCLKNRKGEIKLTGFDLMKQNRNMIRTVGTNFIEDSQANNLRQYFTVGFVYNFSGIGIVK